MMKKRRFTWLDGLICGVVLLAVIGGAILLFGRGDGAVGEERKTYEMTLRFTQATDDPYDYYKVGDTMHFQNRSEELGIITGLKQLDKVYEEFDEDLGYNVEVVDPEKKVIEMKVEVRGILDKGSFTINEEAFYLGKVFYPQSDTTRSIVTVWDIEEVQK